MYIVKFLLNSEPVEVDTNPGEMLSDVLRYRLGLTGTKIGCEELECGSCTVLMDGKAVLSCNFPSVKAQGRSINTIEGLSQNGKLHPLQDAFVKMGAIQCGFCTPGQIMSAASLLEEDSDPSEETIRYALKDTLCRCGAYPSIIQAIQAAAKQLRTGELISTPEFATSSDTSFVGRVFTRPDAVEKATGKARFADDCAPRMQTGGFREGI